VERDKEALARAIHDELGGFLVASAMDLTNLRHRFAAFDDDTRAKFDRLSTMLNRAIDMMRGVIEELHPTLLDNVGLLAALRRQIKLTDDRSSAAFTVDFPDIEPLLSHTAAITLYRVGQEALIVAENHPESTQVQFTIEVDGDSLVLRVVTDGTIGAPLQGSPGTSALEFLHYRVHAMGGTVSLVYPEEGGMSLSVRVLLAQALRTAEAE